MQLSRTAVLCPRQPFHLHAQSQPASHHNSIFAVVLESREAVPRWCISVQAKPTKRLFGHSKPRHTVVYVAGEKTARDGETLRAEDLVVEMLIAESGAAGVEKRVQGAMKKVAATASASAPESWLGEAVAALQGEGLVPGFDVAAFERVAGETLRSQQCHRSIAVEVDYLDEVGMKAAADGRGEVVGLEEKKGLFGFTVTKPQGGHQKPLRRLYSWERQDDPYGGMM